MAITQRREVTILAVATDVADFSRDDLDLAMRAAEDAYVEELRRCAAHSERKYGGVAVFTLRFDPRIGPHEELNAHLASIV